MEEDDYADIEWSETTLENYNNNDNNSNNHGDIQETSAATVIECEKQRRNTSRSTSLYTKEDKRIAARIHKTHLLILLSSLQKLDELASDPFVMGCCLSIVPRDCLWSEEDNIQTQEEWKEKCRRLMLFCIRFVLGNHNQLSTREVFSSHYAFWQPLHMLQWLESPRPLASIFVVFVCAIFRGLGMRCRLVQSLMPFPKQPWWTKEDETSVAKTKVSNRARHLKMARQDCNDNFLWCWLLTPWWMELGKYICLSIYICRERERCSLDIGQSCRLVAIRKEGANNYLSTLFLVSIGWKYIVHGYNVGCLSIHFICG